jgi:UDP-3-O-[3-hydroxymyristoyl] glucosamine N-acyltransferase
VRDEGSLRIIDDVRTLRVAGSTHLTFFKNPKYASQLAATEAGGCILTATSANRAPETAAILTSSAPHSAFAHAVRMFYPESMRTKTVACAAEASGKLVHPTARFRRRCHRAGCSRRAPRGDRRWNHDCGGGSCGLQSLIAMRANSTVDRGALSDTTIGEGTKIDNLSGVVGHVKVGRGAQIAGMARVKDNVEAGARMGGTPARPFKEWAREIAAIKRLGKRPSGTRCTIARFTHTLAALHNHSKGSDGEGHPCRLKPPPWSNVTTPPSCGSR